MATIKDLKSWIERDITRFSPSEVHVLKQQDKGRQLSFRIYTDVNLYSFRAHERDEAYRDTKSYLGCQARSRKPRAGEDWARGNDLADGDLSEETWRKILGDIISYEMVKTHDKYMREKQEPVLLDPKPVNE